MKPIKETKYLRFVTEQIEGRKTKIINVINKSTETELATIQWYGPWRQYCFLPNYRLDTVWNNTCLKDIIEVLDMLMKERQINKPIGE